VIINAIDYFYSEVGPSLDVKSARIQFVKKLVASHRKLHSFELRISDKKNLTKQLNNGNEGGRR